jgi:SAM-dependent methyltransferase
MNLEEYEVMYQVEDHHWWYLGMEQITCRLLDRYLPCTGRTLKILDAGCGTGAVMKYLCQYGEVTGLDFSAEALRFSQKRGHVRLVQASVLAIPLARASFDVIVSFDVICERGVHDEQALAEFARILKPGGLVMLRLPAYRWMRGKHDLATHVSHRYTRAEISAKLSRSGLTPLRLSYANMFLFPIAAVKRLSERLFSPHQTGSDLTLDPGPLNGVFSAILSSEASLVCNVGLPFGLTVVALARKDGLP